MGAWKEHQNHNLKQNLNHNLKQNLNPIPLLGIHHTLVATTSQMLIQGHGIGMDSHLPEVLIHGNYIGMDPQISTENGRMENGFQLMDFWTWGTSSSAGAIRLIIVANQVKNLDPKHQTEQKVAKCLSTWIGKRNVIKDKNGNGENARM